MKWLASFAARILQLRQRWLGLLAGCGVWLAWMIFGFWNTILLILLAGLGYAVGRITEARTSWKDIVEKLLSEHSSDR
ncbi:DUF2273 domain-containing protein [Alicyclobacillus cycloheptanicus]|uniref:Membrane protein n=1 Tax=Alicyclobacillus cycloheptanicus TaxID=1457 RepID=A0ABT9XDI0_9BACL|nr:DUF2273 domain-containing protein [Alicyclobacillus cycloheptanicus]MDQ0188361.1 putative membrane protein [Alicyclobacillus cycloheptanicus]WDM01069.1 DUF2273 domain-containing protein [Alicyclobacillus cycloheptanicus]